MASAGGDDPIWSPVAAEDDATIEDDPTDPAASLPTGAPLDDELRPPTWGEDGDGPTPSPARPRVAVGVVVAVAVAVAVVALLAGYGLGLARGRIQQERGSSPTTSIVRAPGTSAVASTQPESTTSPEPSGDVPTIQHALTFDDGTVPTEAPGARILTSPGWTVEDQQLVAPLPGLPEDADAPTLPGREPVFALAPTDAVSVATVSLTTPTGFSGLTLGDEVRGWQLVVTPGLDQVRLYEVRDGEQHQRGYVERSVEPGVNLGLYVDGDRVGIVVQGQPVEMQTFFGPSTTIGSDHPAARTISLVAGSARTSFDALAFG